jgi:hypothetical protein
VLPDLVSLIRGFSYLASLNCVLTDLAREITRFFGSGLSDSRFAASDQSDSRFVGSGHPDLLFASSGQSDSRFDGSG